MSSLINKISMDLKEDLLWKDSFFKDNFSVDQCLSKYTQKSDLETLRRELKNYGAELQQQMSEILKTETEAIVNLAEYLTNLNSKIENLSVPICQLREEIRTLYGLIESAESSYKLMLEDIKHNNSNRNQINLKLGIITTSGYIDKLIKSSDGDSFEDLLILERVVNKYSFQKNYMDELGIMSDDTKSIVRNVENKLIQMVNKKFLDSFKTGDSETLTRCLRLYDNLRKQDEAQGTFQINIVRPALTPLFNESYLEKCDQNIDKIYNEVLIFMNNKMNILFNILEKNPELKSYNFTLNSFWKEFDKQSRDGLPYITAPGNPELFQKRFKSTWRMLTKIAQQCGNEELVKKDDTFQDHLKRFNLPVYFEIRYQQIAGGFESDILIENSDIYASSNELSCKLKYTLALWKFVKRCFDEDVYIDQLADQFLKLSMMLLSRYLRCFKVTLQEKTLFSDQEKWESYIMDSLIDLNIVENFIALNTENLADIDRTVFKIMHTNMRFVILKVFKTNRKSIDDVTSILKNYLINIKFDESSVHLQNVGAIPRLYRRTNRSAPKDASPYMVEAVKPIIHFHNKFKSAVQKEVAEILDNIITRITKQYLTLVQEVLRSVCKTEESLRRLKSRNVNPSEDSSSQPDTTSDEMKIREQIKYDVAYFLEKLYPIGSPSSRETMDLLRKQTG